MTPELNSIAPRPLGERFKSKAAKVSLGRSICLPVVIFLLLLNGATEGALAKTNYIGEEVKFTNKTEGPAGMKWEWDFGDDSPKSTEKEPTHIYKEPGTWTVSLTVDVPGAGKQPTAKLEIKVLPVIAKAAAAPLEIYIGQEVKFTNTTKGPPGMKWEWDFGDGSPKSDKPEPTHIFKKSDIWDVTLKVEVPNVGVLEKTAKLEIKVLDVIAVPGPKNQEVYIGELVKFTNETKGPEGLTWKWNFWDDNSTSTNKAPTHIYKKKPSKMLVNLTVNVPNVGDREAKELPIDVKMVNAAAAVDSVPFYVGDKVQFRNTTLGPTNMVWEWKFGDRKPVGPENSKKEPTHTYDKNGTYVVTLTVRFKESSGEIIPGIEPVTTTMMITVLPDDIQPTITKIEAGPPTKTEEGKLILPVTVDVNGTGKEVKLKINGKEEIQPFDRKKSSYTFNVDIEDKKPEDSLFPSVEIKELQAEATVTPSGSEHTDAIMVKALSFNVTPDRSVLFWILLGVILLLIGAVVGFILWSGKQPRVEGRLRDMDGSRKIDLYDYGKKKRDLEIDIGDVIPSLAGQMMSFKFRGRKSDPDKEISVLTSNYEVNGRAYPAGEYCEFSRTVIIKIGDHKIELKP